MTDSAIDLTARAAAQEADTKARLVQQQLADHEAECERRWGETRDMIKGLYRRWWWLMKVLVSGMLALLLSIGSLLVKVFLFP